VAALAAVLAVAFYWRVSMRFPKSSDQINTIAAGLDLLTGNWRLHAWTLTAPNFYTSDLWLSALLGGLLRLGGVHRVVEVLLSLQPAVTWTGIVGLSIHLAWRSAVTGREKLGAALLVLAALGVPVFAGGFAAALLLHSAIHLGSVAYCLLAFLLAARAAERPSRWTLCGIGVALALGSFGDPLVLFVGLAPILSLPLARRGCWPMVAAALAGAVAGRALLVLNEATGGFSYQHLSLVFATFGELAANTAACAHDFLDLWSADFTGRPVISALPFLVHLPLAVLAIHYLCRAVIRFYRAARGARDRSMPVLPIVLCVGAAVNVGAAIFSDRFGLEQGTLATGRYLFPAFIYSAVMLAMMVGSRRSAQAMAALALGASLVALPRGLFGAPPDIVPPAQRHVVAWLEQHAPPRGIGAYFASSSIQLASGDRLLVRPGVAWPTDIVQPDCLIGRPFTFAPIVADDFFVLIPPSVSSFSETDAVATWGRPAERDLVSGYVVLIYRHPYAASRPGPKS
jgi:hypothetical protein